MPFLSDVTHDSAQSTHLRVVILDDYQNAVRGLDAFSKLSRHTVMVLHQTESDVNALAARLAGVQALVPIRERTLIDEALLSRLPDLKLISQTGAGVAHIDVEACTRRGIAVAVSDSSAYAPAELTWALVLASVRKLPQEINSAKAGKWQSALIGTSLRGRTLGIFGYGRIGRIVAGYGKAFGMHVLVWGREGSLARAKSDGFNVASSKRALFEQSDVLSLHLKLAPDTHGAVTASDLALMKPSAHFINTSRAGLVTPGALAEALAQGRPGYAAVDVYENEPAINHPLFSQEHALCSPHLGYVEQDAYERFFDGAFDNILAFEAGDLSHLVNPEILIRAEVL